MQTETAEKPDVLSIKAKTEVFKRETLAIVDEGLASRVPSGVFARMILDSIIHENKHAQFLVLAFALEAQGSQKDRRSFQKDLSSTVNKSIAALWAKCHEWGAVAEPLPPEFAHYLISDESPDPSPSK